MIAAEDRVVKPHRTEALLARLDNLVFQATLQDAGHETLYELPAYKTTLQAAFGALRDAASQATASRSRILCLRLSMVQQGQHGMSDLIAIAAIGPILTATDFAPSSELAFVHALRIALAGKANCMGCMPISTAPRRWTGRRSWARDERSLNRAACRRAARWPTSATSSAFDWPRSARRTTTRDGPSPGSSTIIRTI